MSLARSILLALGLSGLAACPNPASAPAVRTLPPPVEGDQPETAPARRLARLLHLEEAGRLPHRERPALAAALRRRAAEWVALGAPAAALADLSRARTLHGADPDPAPRAMEGRILEPRKGPLGSPGLGLLAEALDRPRAAAPARAQRALIALGARLHRWGVAVPPADAPWLMPLPPGASEQRPWALVARGAEEARHAPDPLEASVSEAMEGRLAAATLLAQAAGRRQGSGLRLLARLQALSGQRLAAAETLLHLRERSPGGVTWLLACLEDLGVLGLRAAALRLATPLVEAGPEDPVVLRVLVGLFVAIGEGDRAQLMAERWASLAGDPAEVYRFAMSRFAEAGQARRTARFAARLLSWTDRGHTRRAVARALLLVGRVAEARAVVGPAARPIEALPSAGSTPGPLTAPQGAGSSAAAPGAAKPRQADEGSLARLALGVTLVPARQGVELALCAASLLARAGQEARARRVLADAWLRDPDRFGAAGYRRIAVAVRGRPLSALLPWDRIRRERTCQWRL